MSTFECKLCGTPVEVAPGSKTFTCPECSFVNTAEDCVEEVAQQFNRANTLRRASKFENAAEVYKEIITNYENYAEAYWGLTLCDYGVIFYVDDDTGKPLPMCTKTAIKVIAANNNYNFVLKYADSETIDIYKEIAEKISEIQRKSRNKTELPTEFEEVKTAADELAEAQAKIEEDTAEGSSPETEKKDEGSSSSGHHHHHHSHHHHSHHHSHNHHHHRSSRHRSSSSSHKRGNKPGTNTHKVSAEHDTDMSEAFAHNKDMIERYENIDTVRVSVSDDKVRHHIHENPDVYNINGTTKFVEKKSSRKKDKQFLLITLAIVIPVILFAIMYWFIKTM